MKAILVIELDDDVNLEEVEIRYAIQDMYGIPAKAEVDGCPLKPLPNAINERGKWISEEYQKGWNAFRENLK